MTKTKFDPKKALKEIKTYEIDWNKVPNGTGYSAVIDGTNVTGVISKNSAGIFLCQDKKKWF